MTSETINMAPNPVHEAQTSKRSAAQADLDWPVVTKQRRHYHHHHRLHWKQAVQHSTNSCDDEELIRQQLLRAISMALEAVGFTHAEPVALEGFRAQVEEYMAHFLSIVRQSMLASRRIQPIPQDFELSLASHQLTLQSLLVHLDPPVPPEKCQPTLDAETARSEDDSRQLQLISKMLNESSSKPRLDYIPSNLPSLPSQHTYKAGSVFNQREHDPKRVRELATEEGRLGEEALRRLVGLASSSQPESQPFVKASEQSLVMRTRAHSTEVWKETMEAMSKNQQKEPGSRTGSHDPGSPSLAWRKSSFDPKHVGPAVNADRVHWRKQVPPKLQPNPSNGLGADGS